MKDFKIITSNVWTTTREKKQAVVFNGNAGRDNTIPLVSQSKASYRDNLAKGTKQCAFKKSILTPLIHREEIFQDKTKESTLNIYGWRTLSEGSYSAGMAQW